MTLGPKAKLLIYAVTVVAIVALALYLSSDFQNSQVLADFANKYGYAAAFIVSLISGFNVIIPIPAAALIPVFEGVGLSLGVLLLLVTLGMTMGDVLGYMLGKAGREYIKSKEQQKMLQKLEQLREKNAVWPLLFLMFYSSFAPAPNELIVIPMSLMGYRFIHMFPIIFLGNMLFNTLIALGLIQISLIL